MGLPQNLADVRPEAITRATNNKVLLDNLREIIDQKNQGGVKMHTGKFCFISLKILGVYYIVFTYDFSPFGQKVYRFR